MRIEAARRYLSAGLGCNESDLAAAAHVLGIIKCASFEQYVATVPTAATITPVDADPGNPWARGSSLVVGIYLEGDLSSDLDATLTVFVPRGVQTGKVLRDELLGGDREGTWDVFLAWRCGCRHDTRVVYRSVGDVPGKKGYHGVCPVCSRAAVRVVRTEDAAIVQMRGRRG